MTTPQSLSELFAIDTLLDAEEIAIRDTVRKMVDDRIRPHVGEWFEAAALLTVSWPRNWARSAYWACTSRATAVPG